MSQLIALIIAIALGAIVTAIGYVFLGDAFTSNSERGVALQLVNQASQVEMAMTGYRAENAGSAWTVNSPGGSDSVADFSTVMTTTDTGLVPAGFMKDVPVAPTATGYGFEADGNDVYLTLRADDAELSDNVCLEIRELAGEDVSGGMPTDLTASATSDLVTELGTKRYNCFTDGTNNIFVYNVE
tara:strand:+ start:87 stop:641 length:555 start_codon:yes stop_codon:yes gene_type:complete